MARQASRAPARRAAPAPAPARAAPAPAPAVRSSPPPPAPMQSSQPAGGGMLAGLGATMAQGMAFGAGSAVAHQAVGAASSMLFGGGSKEAAPAPQAQERLAPRAAGGPCEMDRTSLTQCLNSSNASNCDFYFQALQNCQSDNL